MKTRQVCSICLYGDTDYEKTLEELRKSKLSTFIICLEDDIAFPVDELKEVVDYLHTNGKTVMLDTRNCDMVARLNPDIIYVTENAEDREAIVRAAGDRPVVMRFVIGSKETLEERVSEFRHYLTIYQNMVLILRPGSVDVNLFVSWCDEKVDYTMLDKIALAGVPLCLSERYTNSAKDVLDIGEVLTDSLTSVRPDTFTRQYYKSRRYCLGCSKFHQCLGMLKPATFTRLEPNNGKGYRSLYDIIEEMDKAKRLSHGILEFEPSRWKEYEIGVRTLDAMQECRLRRSFDGDNFFYIWDFKESCYFNRPLEEKDVFTFDPRGLMGMNWRFIGKGIKELEWKRKCDLLLPQHGFSTTAMVKFDSFWTDERQKKLDGLTFSTIISVVKEHGGDGHIEQSGNDLLYDGRKFAGKEWMFIQDVGYIENTVVTCEYLPEKEYFERLYHHTGERQITGITEELPSVTKELLMLELSKAIASLLK